MNSEQPIHDDFRSLGGVIRGEIAGQRLDFYLCQNFPFLSRAGWQKRILAEELLVNGAAMRSSYKLREGDRLFFFHPKEHEPDVDKNVQIIWQKQGVLCAYKPSGLPMHENGPYRKNTFSEVLKTMVGPEWAAIHRLDLETSGVVLCGATESIRKHLSDQLEGKTIKKQYLAIGRGFKPQDDWTVNGPIGNLENSEIRIKKWVVPEGLSATTTFHILERRGLFCLMRAIPYTGRTNQIRIHAAYSGLPLVGDKLYHENEEVFLDYFDNGLTDFVLDSTGHTRACLHAEQITFFHPETKQAELVRAEMAEDMKTIWGQLPDPK